jgi:elongation factor G
MVDDTQPWPLIEVAIEPKSKADQEKLVLALAKLAAEDPSFSASIDPESGQTILRGTGELHLDIKIDVLKRTYKVEADVGAPQVAYRETLGRRAEIDYTHMQQARGQFARVKIGFEPAALGSGYTFESQVVGSSVPKEYVQGVEKGLELAKDNGLLAGFPMIDFKATLVDVAYHDVDSSELAFEIAARGAFRELRAKGSPKLLQPIVKIEAMAPEDSWKDVLGWLAGRVGGPVAAEPCGGGHRIVCTAPMDRTFGLWRVLVAAGIKPDQLQIRFDHYAPVPQMGDDDPDPFPAAAALRA